MAFSIGIIAIISIAVSTLLTATFQAQLTHRNAAMVESISMNFQDRIRSDARQSIAVQVLGGPNGAAFSENFTPSVNSPVTRSGTQIVFYYIRTPGGGVNPNVFVTYFLTGPNANPPNALVRVATYDLDTRRPINALTQVFVSNTNQGTLNLRARCINPANLTPTNTCFQFTRRAQYDQVNRNGENLISITTGINIAGLRIDAVDPFNDNGQNPAAMPVLLPMDRFGQPGYNINNVAFDLPGCKVFR
jgi:hypothetical protein